MFSSSKFQSKIISVSIFFFVFSLLAIPFASKADYCNKSGSIVSGYTQNECTARGGTWKTGDPPNPPCTVNGVVSYNYTASECNAKGDKKNTTNSSNTSSKNKYFEGETIGAYINSIYKYGIGVVGILATIVIMIGGLIWITSMGNAARVSSAKDWIGAALTGLALAMFSYTLLWIINPDLVTFKELNLKKIPGSELPTDPENDSDKNTPKYNSKEDCLANCTQADFACKVIYDKWKCKVNCGSIDKTCCTTMTACNAGECTNGTCSECGSIGKACCTTGTACNTGECTNSTCSLCGSISLPCCTTGTACTVGSCISNHCGY